MASLVHQTSCSPRIRSWFPRQEPWGSPVFQASLDGAFIFTGLCLAMILSDLILSDLILSDMLDDSGDDDPGDLQKDPALPSNPPVIRPPASAYEPFHSSATECGDHPYDKSHFWDDSAAETPSRGKHRAENPPTPPQAKRQCVQGVAVSTDVTTPDPTGYQGPAYTPGATDLALHKTDFNKLPHHRSALVQVDYSSEPPSGQPPVPVVQERHDAVPEPDAPVEAEDEDELPRLRRPNTVPSNPDSDSYGFTSSAEEGMANLADRVPATQALQTTQALPAAQAISKTQQFQSYNSQAAPQLFQPTQATTNSNPTQPLFVRPPFPPPVKPKSPIPGLSPSPILQLCFRIGELINRASKNRATNQPATYELYARVKSSSRDPFSSRGVQHFEFMDLFKDHPPHLAGTLSGWKTGGLVDRQSAEFLGVEEEGEPRMCRCVCRMKRVVEKGKGVGWVVEVVSIREAGWENVEWVRGVAFGG